MSDASSNARTRTGLLSGRLLIWPALAGLCLGIGILVHQSRTDGSDAYAIALDGAGKRNSDWYAAKLLGYVSVQLHADPYTRSALEDTLVAERRGSLPGSATVVDVALDADGEVALVSDAVEGTGIWHLKQDATTDRENLQGTRGVMLDDESGPVALSPDGRVAVAGDSAGGDITMWDLGDPDEPAKTAVRVGGYQADLLDLSLSADGKTLFAGFGNGSVEIWQLPTGTGQQPRLLSRTREHASGVHSLAAGDDGRLLLTVSDDAAVTWLLADRTHPSVATKLISAELDPGTRSWSSGALSADGRRAIIGGAVYDLTDPRRPVRLGALPIPPEPGTSVAISRDGSVAATVHDEPGDTSGRDPVVVWGLRDASVPAELATLRAPDSGFWRVAMSANGQVVTAGTRTDGGYSWLLPAFRNGLIRDACVGAGLIRPDPEYWKTISGAPRPDLLDDEPFAICPRLDEK
ncbi:hypothetical protein MF672_042475 [Actinomadura sp. ATCC 31491]|uniref:WD40 repeat domain-containing protein n=1 Tax=Actinomadura luzonensis TaxID=2805427 RepID=A0ABT0G8I0_9ACTN|nr:hypothetical protein [Actinomadura luzonensis]MCK2220426.1 hypothetical protein [Actinomadura luzonensis]